MTTPRAPPLIDQTFSHYLSCVDTGEGGKAKDNDEYDDKQWLLVLQQNYSSMIGFIYHLLTEPKEIHRTAYIYE
jgi:hypothetical protein